MKRAISIIGTILMAALVAPTAVGAQDDDAQENLVIEFTATGTHGYRLLALAAPPPPGSEAGEGELGLFLQRGRRAEVSYAIPDATVTEKRIEADLGTLGRIDLTRTSTGRSKVVHEECLPEGKGRSIEYHYRGTVEFHGEEGFTEVDATAVRGEVSPFCGFPEGGRPAGKSLPGARLAVEREVGDELRTSFSAVQRRPGGRTLIGAETMETRNGIEIHRGIGVRAPASALSFDRGLRGATVKPPAPFSGFGRFRARPGASGRGVGSWSGNLTVDLPGHADLPVTGPGFRASLEHPRR